MKNTNKEFAEALRLMDIARDLQEEATSAIKDCINYIEFRSEKFLWNYGTDLFYHSDLLEAIESYIAGDKYVTENYKTLEYDIKEAMEIQDYDEEN
jgi:hypothetical protein